MFSNLESLPYCMLNAIETSLWRTEQHSSSMSPPHSLSALVAAVTASS